VLITQNIVVCLRLWDCVGNLNVVNKIAVLYDVAGLNALKFGPATVS
jgi:hypothetical protein